MSQKFIREGANLPWYKRAWMILHEPRLLSAIYGTWYIILTLIWGRAIFTPPQTIEGALGENGMTLIAAIITIGSVIGIATVATGTYWAERTAMALVALGLIGYLAIVVWLEITGTGNRQPGMASTIGAIGFTLIRSWWIYDRPYHPDRQPTDT